MYPCSKEAEIASMDTTLKRISKIVEGNGQPGLDKQVNTLNTIIPSLQKSVEELNDKVQQLLDKRLLYEGARNEKMNAKQKLAAIITGIIGAAAVIVMIVDLVIKYKETL